MTNIIMAIAIVVLTAAICVLTKKQKDIEEELDTFASSEVEVPELNSIETQVAKANDDIEKIFARLKEITEDIGRLDQISKQDRARVIEITRKYVNYREPLDNGSGVPWASEYKCNEEEEHE